MASKAQRGACCKDDDFVKCFVPSLFDSDSDAEDIFTPPPNTVASSVPLHRPLHVHLGKPMKKTTSSEAFSKVQSYNKRPLTELGIPIKEEQPEASSPSSQGNSNTSTQTPFSGALESSDSMDSASPFYSVLSFESSDTVFDFDTSSFADEPSAKRQKAESARAVQQSPIPSSTALNSPAGYGMRVEASLASSLPSAHSLPTPSRLPPALLARHSLPPLPCLAYNAGGVTTGIPVDHSPSEMTRSWVSAQAMIPTSPSASFYSGHYGSHIPANLPAPVTSIEKIAAALMEVKSAPLAPSPLGLRLDKSKVASGLQALGMVLKD